MIINRYFRKTKEWLTSNALEITVCVMFIVLMILFFASRIFIIIQSGQAGVYYRLFNGGTVTDYYFGEGIHVIPPWNKVYIYDVRLQEESRLLTVLTKDGLTVEAEVSFRYSPNVHTLGILHKFIGPDYAKKVVTPEVEADSRNIISSYDLEQLYDTDRRVIQQMISDSVLTDINNQVILDTLLREDGRDKTYILFQDIFIKNISLPKKVAEGIEDKIVAEQELLTYTYILETERREAERKRIEAVGIDSFQSISRISILKWRGLEVTRALGESPNTKLVIMGTDESLPIILNGEVTENDTNK